MDHTLAPCQIPLDAGTLLVTGTGVSELLQRCCALSSPAHLMAVDGQGTFQAHFRGVTREWVSFGTENGGPVRPRAVYSVTFDWRHQVCLFLGLALPAPKTAGGPKEARFLLPGWIVRADCRSALRIPLPAHCRLQVQVHTETFEGWSAQPVDLSLYGIQVKFAEALPRPLYPGDVVSLDLDYGEGPVRIDAEVRRRQEQGYGLLFLTPGGPGAEPPESLERIFRAVERDYLVVPGP